MATVETAYNSSNVFTFRVTSVNSYLLSYLELCQSLLVYCHCSYLKLKVQSCLRHSKKEKSLEGQQFLIIYVKT